MTDEQAQQVASSITKERVVELLREHWQMKQCLCAQILGVPTGAEDWLKRAFRKADHLRNCEHQLRQMISGVTKLAEEATWQTLVQEDLTSALISALYRIAALEREVKALVNQPKPNNQ